MIQDAIFQSNRCRNPAQQVDAVSDRGEWNRQGIGWGRDPKRVSFDPLAILCVSDYTLEQRNGWSAQRLPMQADQGVVFLHRHHEIQRLPNKSSARIKIMLGLEFSAGKREDTAQSAKSKEPPTHD